EDLVLALDQLNGNVLQRVVLHRGRKAGQLTSRRLGCLRLGQQCLVYFHQSHPVLSWVCRNAPSAKVIAPQERQLCGTHGASVVSAYVTTRLSRCTASAP